MCLYGNKYEKFYVFNFILYISNIAICNNVYMYCIIVMVDTYSTSLFGIIIYNYYIYKPIDLSQFGLYKVEEFLALLFSSNIYNIFDCRNSFRYSIKSLW